MTFYLHRINIGLELFLQINSITEFNVTEVHLPTHFDMRDVHFDS